jgi:hypothetical protein
MLKTGHSKQLLSMKAQRLAEFETLEATAAALSATKTALSETQNAYDKLMVR